MYDYLIVGAGLFGSVCAHELTKKGKKCLVIDKKSHVGGQCYTENLEGINVHKYGAHIFHTSNADVWNFILQFADFNYFVNSPIARYKNEVYNLPFNMNTFSKMWGIALPSMAESIINNQKKRIKGTPKNLEEQAISLVGYDVYEKLIKGYTEKQWGVSCKELPPSIIKRIPVRFTYDNNYFDDTYQGIPIGGYTKMISNMLKGCKVMTDTEFKVNKDKLVCRCANIIYTGPIDEYYDYCYGKLDYRSLVFNTGILNEENHQGVAVVNYTDKYVSYTRCIEHKHFENVKSNKTVVTYEYPAKYEDTGEPYYPINNERNDSLLAKYKELAEKETNVYFGGRLAEYKYYDMDDTIESALRLVETLE